MQIISNSSRYTAYDLGDILKIIISSKKQWFFILYMIFWIILWATVEFYVLLNFSNQLTDFGPIIIPWFGGWTISIILIIYILTWKLFGKEVIEISYKSIRINRVIFGFGIPKEYPSENIKYLCVTNKEISRWPRKRQLCDLSIGIIAFNFGSKIIYFGSGIDETDAKQIIEEINQRFPQYRSRIDQD